MSYYEKYIKYKSKYLKLKEQSGGGNVVIYFFNAEQLYYYGGLSQKDLRGVRNLSQSDPIKRFLTYIKAERLTVAKTVYNSKTIELILTLKERSQFIIPSISMKGYYSSDLLSKEIIKREICPPPPETIGGGFYEKKLKAPLILGDGLGDDGEKIKIIPLHEKVYNNINKIFYSIISINPANLKEYKDFKFDSYIIIEESRFGLGNPKYLGSKFFIEETMTADQVKKIDNKYNKIEKDLKEYLKTQRKQKEPELEYDLYATESK
jgi:hypothetical protein